MSILHLETNSLSDNGNQLQQFTISIAQGVVQFGHVANILSVAWQGYSSDQFLGELQPLIQRLTQLGDDGLLLSQRLQREVEEWEQVAGQLSAGPLAWQAALLQSAGGGDNRWLLDGLPGWQTALPPLAIISQLGGWLDTWPDWLKAQLNPFLPFLQPPAPEPAGPTRLGELLDEPVAQEPTKEAGAKTGVGTAVPTTTQTAPAANGYPVPLKAQGSLGGSAACAPTSVSMILDYYHNLDGQNQTATPQELLTMLDKGDFTQGKGMSLSRITDELQDLGYTNISAQVNASQTDLQNQLQQGPVIATVRLNMQTNQLTATGSVVHAVVVKGVSSDGQTVFINDPWTGSEVLLPLADFAATWQGGSNGLYVIRP